MDLEEYLALKKKLESLQSRKDRLEGSLESLLADLQEKFSCESLERAEKLLLKLKKQQEKEEQELLTLLKEWKKKYGQI